MPAPVLPSDLAEPVEALRVDLDAVFGPRLRSLLAYGSRLFPPVTRTPRSRRPPLNTLALVDAVSFDDLQACAGRAPVWQRRELAVPLILGADEFAGSLDVFPFDYGDIIARHVVVAGPDPFEGVSVKREDLRRACEAQAKRHLIHLREGYLEAHGRPDAIADLVLASATPFATLLGNVARLRGSDAGTPEALARAAEGIGGVAASTVREILGLLEGRVMGDDEAGRLYGPYLQLVTQLVIYLDTGAQADPA